MLALEARADVRDRLGEADANARAWESYLQVMARSFGVEMELISPQEAQERFPLMSLDGVVGATIRNNLLYENRANGISIFQIDGSSFFMEEEAREEPITALFRQRQQS